MRHLTLIVAAVAFTFGGLAAAQAACPGHMQTVQSPSDAVVASTNGGSTPIVAPQPKSGS